MKTLPNWARELGMPGLDVVRKTIRRSPELKALGKQFGAVRLYDAAEAERIKNAVESRTTVKT